MTIVRELPTEIDASLRERARLIIADLEAAPASSGATTLEAWMAHYIAELVHRADDAAVTPEERSAAARDCAHSVLQLWQLRQAREQAQLGYLIFRDRLRETLKTSRALVAALGHASSTRSWSSADRLGALFELARVDEELIRALYAANIRQETARLRHRSQKLRRPSKSAASAERSGKPSAEAGAGAAGQSESQEDGIGEGPPDEKDVQAVLARAVAVAGTLFPGVAKADPSHHGAFSIAIVSALVQTSRLRIALLGDLEGAAARAESPQRTRRARPARRRRRQR